jgi:hypothetical protein
MTIEPDDPLDRRARAALEAVKERWRVLLDLPADDKALALKRLDDLNRKARPLRPALR